MNPKLSSQHIKKLACILHSVHDIVMYKELYSVHGIYQSQGCTRKPETTLAAVEITFESVTEISQGI